MIGSLCSGGFQQNDLGGRYSRGPHSIGMISANQNQAPASVVKKVEDMGGLHSSGNHSNNDIFSQASNNSMGTISFQNSSSLNFDDDDYLLDDYLLSFPDLEIGEEGAGTDADPGGGSGGNGQNGDSEVMSFLVFWYP